MRTILSVDDEQDMEMLISQKFRKQIRNNEYNFIFAQNGVQALEKISQHPEICLVLSDINMPEMDGLSFLTKLKEQKNSEIRAVMVSAYGDMENIRTAMNRGAFDFVTKPINFDDLEITITKTLNEIETYHLLQKDRDNLLSIQKDLSIAHDIQQSMLPKKYPPFPERADFDLHCMLEPAKAVGGDLYDYFLIDNDHLFFMIGDVSDKGVSAALFMSIAKSLFKSHFSKNNKPDIVEEVKRINSTLSQDNTSMMFVTFFVGILNLKTGDIEYVDGGHECPLIMKADSSVQVFQKKTGLPIAVDPDFPYQSDKFSINPGDRLFLYTDGLEDAQDINGKRRSLEPTLDLLRTIPPSESLPNINNRLMAETKAFIGAASQFDDIAILAISYKGEKAS